MPVVVGKTDDQTPTMIGLLRYALLNPYWNVPPDLVREKIAPAVLREGAGYMARRRFEALADFSPGAAILDPAGVDWAAVAAGARTLRVRQLPGGDNLMGQLKFMLPNPLGIYLHDTPLRTEFAADLRTDSHGCVRLQDAARLALWILGHSVAAAPSGGPDQRVDIGPPIAVYILYLTAQPQPGGGVTFLSDIYHRDPPLLAALGARAAQSRFPAGGGLH
jgi:murein L,D-transpeptidase YcbB/YkuD